MYISYIARQAPLKELTDEADAITEAMCAAAMS